MASLVSNPHKRANGGREARGGFARAVTTLVQPQSTVFICIMLHRGATTGLTAPVRRSVSQHLDAQVAKLNAAVFALNADVSLQVFDAGGCCDYGTV